MSANEDVRAPSASAALNSMAAGDAAPMSDAWAQGFEFSAQHPIGGRNEGYDAVIASFAKVAEIAGGGDIKLLEQKIDAASDMAKQDALKSFISLRKAQTCIFLSDSYVVSKV